MPIIVGFDIETTGLDQEKGHRIIEVAACLYDMNEGGLKPLGKYIRRINPQRSIDAGALAVHGITFDMLTGCPVWEEVAPKLVKIFEKSDLIVAHNGHGFDMPFVAGELIRIGSHIPKTPCFDTMREGRWSTPLGKLPSLRELCFACGVDYDTDKAHAAEYDTEVLMQCFWIGYKKGFFKLPEVNCDP